MMQHKDFGLSIKAVSDSGEIEGYGSTFGGEPDSYGDVVAKGAFADSLAAHKAAGTMPKMLWGHKADDPPIGDWLNIEEDEKGLFVKGRVDIEDPFAARIYRAMKAGRVNKFSIGYSVDKWASDAARKGVRILQKLALWEISPVNFPANVNAGVTSVKNDDAFSRWMAGVRPQRRELERYLKDGFGVSNSEAERMANALLNEDRGGRDDAEALAFLKGMAG